MDQLISYADARLVVGCVYCGGPEETRDHVPSRVLLEEPFPENLPAVRACRRCNSSFSLDEEYVACLIACAKAGTADPDRLLHSRASKILRRKHALHMRIEQAITQEHDQVYMAPEVERVKNVVVKLCAGSCRV